MKRKSLIAALLLLAAGIQTMQAQMVTIYRAGQQPLVYSVLEVDSISFDENQTVANGHEYIDLGLPSGTLWATMNVGADSIQNVGDRFAWGEAQTKESFGFWSGYQWCNGTFEGSDEWIHPRLTKYCTDGKYGYNGLMDGKTELEPEDDAATVNWGSQWQMPSYRQQAELVDENYTLAEDVELNGAIVKKVTSKQNGKSIFLPYTSYWSRSLSKWSSNTDMAYYLSVFSGESGLSSSYAYRYNGYRVRPVLVQETEYSWFVTSIELDKTEIVLYSGEDVTLYPTVLPSYASNTTLAWESSDEAVAQVDNGHVTVGKIGSCVITCRATDGSGVYAECQISVERGYVDLGLPSRTLWATCNIGADRPEEFGDYFAWGETEPKEEYSWSTYKYCDGTEDTMTKYCNDSSSDYYDKKRRLDPEDDAAIANWGNEWQMPSAEQIEELITSQYTTTTWTTRNGVNGRLVVSKKNGNSIFLPAAGCRLDTGFSEVGNKGYYSGNYTGGNLYQCASCLYFTSGHIQGLSLTRRSGFSIRPVRKK